MKYFLYLSLFEPSDVFRKSNLILYSIKNAEKEIEDLEAAGVQLLPKPPQVIPLLKTPPPSVLCEPMSGKYLEFSGPRNRVFTDFWLKNFQDFGSKFFLKSELKIHLISSVVIFNRHTVESRIFTIFC